MNSILNEEQDDDNMWHSFFYFFLRLLYVFMEESGCSVVRYCHIDKKTGEGLNWHNRADKLGVVAHLSFPLDKSLMSCQGFDESQTCFHVIGWHTLQVLHLVFFLYSAASQDDLRIFASRLKYNICLVGLFLILQDVLSRLLPDLTMHS